MAEVIAEAMTIELEPLEDTIVPDTLITPEELAIKASFTRPAFVPLDGKVTIQYNASELYSIKLNCSNSWSEEQ